MFMSLVVDNWWQRYSFYGKCQKDNVQKRQKNGFFINADLLTGCCLPPFFLFISFSAASAVRGGISFQHVGYRIFFLPAGSS